MPIDYYHFDVSPPCSAVNLCIAALGIPVNRKEVNTFKKQTLDPEYVKVMLQFKLPYNYFC